MKTSCRASIFIVLVIFWVLGHTNNNVMRAGSGSGQNTTIAPGIFYGQWQGKEQCQHSSSNAAILNITAGSKPGEVTITGIYSLQGKVKGLIKANKIDIPIQMVDDPLLKNIGIEGTLTLSQNHKTLGGMIKVLNNEQRDECLTVYNR